MARKRLKRGNGKDEHSDSDPVVDVDRISTLPDPLIYHILSFVPTVFVVRMSVLSRRWRRVWHSVPTLHFPHSDGRGFKHEGAFNLFVEKCLKLRQEVTRFVADSSVTTFKLEIYSSPDCFARLNKWFHSSVIVNNIKELDLCLRTYQRSFKLPSAVLNGRCLTRLKLDDCVKISSSCSVNLPSLKSLSLKNVLIDSKVLYNLVLGCPSLEKCVLTNIFCIGELRISSLSLNFLDVEADYETVATRIEAVNLQTLVLRCDFCFPHDFNFLTGIRELLIQYLSCSVIKKFEDEIPKLTSLENLTLETCDEFFENEMRISNRNVKSITFCKEFASEFKLTIDSCNLVSFICRADTKFSLSMWKSNVKGKFSIWRDTVDETNWYTELITFLSNINCEWTSIELYLNEDKDLIVPKNLRASNPPWPDLKHLTVTTRKASTRKAEFRKALKWLCPSLQTLTIETNPNYSL